MTYNRRRHRFLGILSVVALGACADSGPSSPLAPSESPLRSNGVSATLLECEALTSVAATDTIGLLGGTLKVTDAAGGTHEVVFPANAVADPTVFTLSVPAAKYVEVRVTARDLLGNVKGTINFPVDAQPTLAISYRRCTRSNVTNKALGLYNIDETTNAILQGPFGAKEGNTADPRVIGKVPHFSDYAIGQP